MKTFLGKWRRLLAYMILFPWPIVKMPHGIAGGQYKRDEHLQTWWFGWAVSLAGIVAIGFYAPFWTEIFIIPRWGFFGGYEEYVIAGLAFFGGLIWQLLFVMLSLPASIIANRTLSTSENILRERPNYVLHTVVLVYSLALLYTSVLICYSAPFLLSGWFVFWYLAHFAPNHGLVGTGIIGGTLLKIIFTFVPGIVKGFLTGAFFTWLVRTINGNKDNTNSAT